MFALNLAVSPNIVWLLNYVRESVDSHVVLDEPRLAEYHIVGTEEGPTWRRRDRRVGFRRNLLSLDTR
jgi:hypothetical protein